MHQSLLARPLTKLQTSALSDRKNLWLASIAGAVVVLIVYLLVPPAHQSSSVLLTVIGGLGALAFYLNSRHAAHAKFVKELLTEFNDRYDKLGSDLQFAISKRGDFEQETELKFVRYFNLCAEEWLFWKAGYIHDPVWDAWKNGMKQYSKDARVMAIWEKERETSSYYGFELPR